MTFKKGELCIVWDEGEKHISVSLGDGTYSDNLDDEDNTLGWDNVQPLGIFITEDK